MVRSSITKANTGDLRRLLHAARMNDCPAVYAAVERELARR